MQQLKELQFEAENNSGIDGIRTYDLCVSGTNAVPLSFKARVNLLLRFVVISQKSQPSLIMYESSLTLRDKLRPNRAV